MNNLLKEKVIRVNRITNNSTNMKTNESCQNDINNIKQEIDSDETNSELSTPTLHLEKYGETLTANYTETTDIVKEEIDLICDAKIKNENMAYLNENNTRSTIEEDTIPNFEQVIIKEERLDSDQNESDNEPTSSLAETAADKSKGAGGKKKTRKAITLDTKIKIIKLSDAGASNTEIGRKLNLPRTTVVTVVKNKDKIVSEVRSATPVNTTIIRKRDNLIAEMEEVLMVWIDEETGRGAPLTQAIIQKKALDLFADLKTKRGGAANETEFGASRGWFCRFKNRSYARSIKIRGEATSSELAEVIEEGGYTKMQVFNVEETGLFWKKMPVGTFSAAQDKSSGLKLMNDRLCIVLGANAAGDFKLKPMVVSYSENPKAFKSYNNKSSLPVTWRSDPKGWINETLFMEWFSNYFIPAVQTYCTERDLPFKILLVLNDVPQHPKRLQGLNPNIQLLFLPTGTTSLLPPLAQGVTAAFKSYYLRKIFALSERNRFIDFWKGFTILDGIKAIRDAWDEVKPSTLQGVWKQLYPQFIDDLEAFENPTEEVNAHILALARRLDLEVQPEAITDLLQSHSQPPTNEERPELEEHSPDEEELGATLEEISCEQLAEAFNHLEMAMAIFEKVDPNFERSSDVNAGILDQYACYRDMYKKYKTVQSLPEASASSSTPSLGARRSPSTSPARKRFAFDKNPDGPEAVPSTSSFVP